jgi:F0F1-type ATP synthase alpha subunit
VRVFLDKINVKDILSFEKEFVEFVKTGHYELLKELQEKNEVSSTLDKQLENVAKTFTQNYIDAN